MSEAMMQNMMKFFSQQMMQLQNVSGTPTVPNQMSDLEKFFAHKVSDMNSFYSQLNIQPK